MIVADANLLAPILLGGRDAALAQRVYQRDPSWAAPLLWRSELRSILAASMGLRGLTFAEAWAAHEMAERLLTGREFAVEGESVLRLVQGSKCSAYDCEYVALAQQLRVPLVTFDRQVLREYPAAAVRPEDFSAGR